MVEGGPQSLEIPEAYRDQISAAHRHVPPNSRRPSALPDLNLH
jgi:hypothetical protein